jgi:hypothetical protein
MIEMTLLHGIKKLNQFELYELDRHIHNLIGHRVTYYQKNIRCGQSRCKKCRVEKVGHGKAWFAKFRHEGCQHLVYLGKEPREISIVEEIQKKKERSKKGEVNSYGKRISKR